MIKISFRFEDEFVDAIYINNSIIIIYLCPLHKKIVCAKPPKRGPYSFWFFRSHISSWCVILTLSNIKGPPWKWKKLGCPMGNVLWKFEVNKIQNFLLVALPIIKKITSRWKKCLAVKLKQGLFKSITAENGTKLSQCLLLFLWQCL